MFLRNEKFFERSNYMTWWIRLKDENKNKHMKKSGLVKMMAVLLLGSSLLTGCGNDENGNGTISLNLTDAPTDAENVAGVYVTITGVEYRVGEKSWQPFEGFGDPYTVNLLDLTDGKTALLGDFNVEAGKYDGLRFKLDASENGGKVTNAATYIEFTDGSTQPLFVPSGTQSGYKAKGSFVVPVNGSVFITADFDVRKSVVEAGASGKYLLKPTIRLVVNDQAGAIEGELANAEENLNYVVFAYEEGAFSEEELAEPAEGEARFPSSVSSAKVKDDGSFSLPFLAAGSYQLVIVAYVDGAFQEVAQVAEELVEVKSKETTTVTVSL